MMKKTTHSFLLIATIISHYAAAMEVPKTHLMVIPGQNGLGGQNINTVLPYFADKDHLKHCVETPLNLPDFGQSRCQNYLQKKINLLNQNEKVIIHASSQGT